MTASAEDAGSPEDIGSSDDVGSSAAGAPLEGWTVVVTRAEGSRGRLGSAFVDAGARVLRVPTVEIGPPGDPAPLARAVARLAEYHWIVFTSGRAVDALAERIGVPAEQAGASGDPAEGAAGRVDAPGTGVGRLPSGIRVAAVGPSTADRARKAGFPVAFVGDGSGGEELARRLAAEGVGEGGRILLPTSSRGRRELEDVLREAGAVVDRVVAYETRIRSFDPAAVPDLADADVVTFTSPSSVEGWHSAMADDPARFLSPSVGYVVIGSTTGAAAAERGIEFVEAEEASFESMVEAVRRLAARRGEHRKQS